MQYPHSISKKNFIDFFFPHEIHAQILCLIYKLFLLIAAKSLLVLTQLTTYNYIPSFSQMYVTCWKWANQVFQISFMVVQFAVIQIHIIFSKFRTRPDSKKKLYSRLNLCFLKLFYIFQAL